MTTTEAIGARISDVYPEDLPLVWPQVEKAMKRGLRHADGDTMTLEGLYRDVLEKRSIMWARHEGVDVSGVVIFDIREIKRRRILFVRMLAGRNLNEWIANGLELLTDYAKLSGARGLRCICRPGLARLLKRSGWKKRAVVMEMD